MIERDRKVSLTGPSESRTSQRDREVADFVYTDPVRSEVEQALAAPSYVPLPIVGRGTLELYGGGVLELYGGGSLELYP